ncbi:MAG: cytochrome c biogenesis CcdA family protein [Acidimicrobiia bacterium]
MTESVTLVAAFGGGLVSFLSPCVLPIVPAYLAIITGLDVGDIEQGRGNLPRIARDTGMFVAGFSAVFVLLGLSATAVGSTLTDNQGIITRLSGLVVLAMALFLLGSLVARAPWLYQERRFHPDLSRFGPLAAPVAGVAFGFGWTPCIGPVLTSILALAATQDGVGRGALLLAVYSAGLGVPFLATGLALGRLGGALGWVKRHLTGITVASATSLAVFGVILALDRLVWVTTRLQEAFDAVGLGPLVELG